MSDPVDALATPEEPVRVFHVTAACAGGLRVVRRVEEYVVSDPMPRDAAVRMAAMLDRLRSESSSASAEQKGV